MKRTLSADKLQMITQHTQERIDRGEISGSVSLVAQDGKLLYAKAQGYANYTRKVPLKTDTIFRLASMTKPIIGVAVMQLEEQGKLSLDGPLSRYIPEFAGLQACESGKLVAVNREIMIRDLLSHSCGLGQEEQGLQYIAENLPIGPNDTLASYVPKLAQVPLDFQPGTKTGYSPMAAFDILARVVEIVSGQTVDRYLQDHIFIPLDMRDTAFVLTGAQKSRLVEMTDHVGGVLTGVSDDGGTSPGHVL
ncbi:MAG: serine hydrolase domain-containing protein [Hydrogeniiclostridium mannosilyticum]